MPESGEIRIGDAERQEVIDLLRRHTGEGRLTLDEFSDRAGEVFAARTRADLRRVIEDLPEGVRPPPGPAAPVASPAPSTPDQPGATAQPGRRRFVAIMSSSTARGRWRAAESMSAFAFWGGVHIDLRDALIESPVVEIWAWAIMGAVTVSVPPGIPVEVDGLVLMGGSGAQAPPEEPIAGAPLVRVHARGLWGSVDARTRRPRERSGRPHLHRELRHELRHELRRVRRDPGRYGPDAVAAVNDIVGRSLDLVRDTTRQALTGQPLSDHHRDIPGREAQPAGTSAAGAAPEAPTAGSPPPGSPPPAAPAPAAPTAGSPPPGSPPPGSPPPAAPAPGSPPPGSPSGWSPPEGSRARIPPGTLTILVSDIVESTPMTERLGDQRWLEVLQSHNRLMRRELSAHGGTEVKAQGDGFLAVFPSARTAALAAIAIQQALAAYRDEHPDLPVEVRLGLHTGEVAVDEDDVFGHNVVLASRIAEAAVPGEILASAVTHDVASSSSDLHFDGGRELSLKGVSRPWRVHRLESR